MCEMLTRKYNLYHLILYMSTYREKYHKYKEKYFRLLLEGGSYDIDSNTGKFLDDYEEPEDIEGILKAQRKSRGYDIYDADSNGSTTGININEKIRGKIYEVGDFNKSNFVSLGRSSSPNKILAISNQDEFDKFTEKFGTIDKKGNNINIKWENVARLYKGIYITSSAVDERDIDIPFRNRAVGSWINQGYDYIDDVVVFLKDRSGIPTRSITSPFHAKVIDSYAFDEDDFVKINDAVPNNKVLLIDDVKSFDIFTNKYGKVAKKKKMEYIDINWHNVKKDYEGILIDKDSLIKLDRYEIAFMRGNRYQSWWEMNQIEQGVIYIFN